MIAKLSRRELLLLGLGTAGSGAALVVGVWYGQRRERWKRRPIPRSQPLAPSAFVALDEDGVVTVWLHKAELGQGVMTALPMLVADELGADFSQVRVEQAIASEHYGDMMTAVSSSVRNHHEELRRAGATAREMLIAAFCAQLGVEARDCRSEASFIVHTSGRRAPFKSLVALAAGLPVPAEAPLKPISELKLVGTSPTRLDLEAKVTGAATFGLDVRLPGQLYAVIARPPELGATLGRWDGQAALKVPGVVAVEALPAGIAVLAEHSYAAQQGRAALQVEWTSGPHAQLDSAAIEAQLQAALDQTGAVARNEGDAVARCAGSARPVQADYALPYLAHAPMEPPNSTAWFDGERLTLWAPMQDPLKLRDLGAELSGLPIDRVAVHTPFVGGAFGRRVEIDEHEDAIRLSVRARRPVQVLWTREDDLAHDYFRPASHHRMRGALDAEGWPVAWHHHHAGPSILARDPRFQEAIDPTSAEGAVEVPYAIPDLRVELSRVALPIKTGFWRSVGHSANAFVVESFLDELALAGGKDPAELRRRLLAKSPRHLAVLEAVLKAADWGRSLPQYWGQGLAVHASFGSYVAMVAEVHVVEERVRCEKVFAAVDCGLTVHPDTVRALIEGGIVFGLSAVLDGQITLQGGRVLEQNFHQYRPLRITEMPQVEVHLLSSPEAPGGVGEIGVPPIAPAITNALARALGRRIRTLPIGEQLGTAG